MLNDFSKFLVNLSVIELQECLSNLYGERDSAAQEQDASRVNVCDIRIAAVNDEIGKRMEGN